MPTVIDQLVVLLDLDPADNFTKKQKTVDEGVKKLRNSAVDNRKTWEENNKRVAESFKGVTNQVIGLGLAIVGASSIIDFAKQTIALDANVGRLSKNLGVSTEILSTWEGAVREVGGTTQDANAAMQSLVGAFQQYQTTGTTPILGTLQRIGMTINDLRDPMQALIMLNERFSKMTGAQASYTGAQLGLSQNVVNLLEQDPAKFQQYLRDAAAAYEIHKKDADAAAAAQKQISLLADAYKRLGNDVLNSVLPGLIDFANELTNFAETDPGIKQLGIDLNAMADAWAKAFGIKDYNKAGGMIRELQSLEPPLHHLLQALTAVGDAFGALFSGNLTQFFTDLGIAGVQIGESVRTFFDTKKALNEHDDSPYTGQRVTSAQIKGELGKGVGLAPAGVAAPGNVALGSTVASLLAARGVNIETAKGIGAAVVAEGGSEHTRDQYQGSHYAYGIFQARGKLQRDLFAKYGPNPTIAQQIDWFLSERGKGVGVDQVLAAGSSQSALTAMIRSFLQPGTGAAGDFNRGAAAIPHITVTIVDKVGVKATVTAKNSAVAAQANRGLS